MAGIIVGVTAAATTAALVGRVWEKRQSEKTGLLGIESAHPYLAGDWVSSRQREGQSRSKSGRRHQRRR